MVKINRILVEGTFYAPSGYSSTTRNFFHEFIKNYGDEYKINLIDRQWDRIRMNIHERYQDTIIKNTVKEDLKDVDPARTMILRWGIPPAFQYDGFDEAPHRIKAIYFVWELNRIPPVWIEYLKYYDYIFTCSNASKKAIEDSIKMHDLHIPVYVIPHGVVGEDYYPIKGYKKTLEGFTFLHIGTFMKRKAPYEMIKTFLKTFTDKDAVRLIWKIGDMIKPADVITLRKEIQKLVFSLDMDVTNAPRLIIDANVYATETLNALYNEADCVLQVSRGEAWSLPILNGMATGTVTLSLRKGGHRSYVTEKNGFFVKEGELTLSDGKDWYSTMNGNRWWNLDMDDYAKMMRYVYENDLERQVKVEQGLLTAKKFSWKNVARAGYKVFKKIEKQT